MRLPIEQKMICPTVGIEWIAADKFGLVRLMAKDSTPEHPIIRGACHILVHRGIAELKALIMKDSGDDLSTSEFKAVNDYLHDLNLSTKVRRLKRDGRVRVTEYSYNGTISHYYED